MLKQNVMAKKVRPTFAKPEGTVAIIGLMDDEEQKSIFHQGSRDNTIKPTHKKPNIWMQSNPLRRNDLLAKRGGSIYVPFYLSLALGC